MNISKVPDATQEYHTLNDSALQAFPSFEEAMRRSKRRSLEAKVKELKPSTLTANRYMQSEEEEEDESSSQSLNEISKQSKEKPLTVVRKGGYQGSETDSKKDSKKARREMRERQIRKLMTESQNE